MGKTGGFLEHARQAPGYRPAGERIRDFKAVEIPLGPDELHNQLARCMECGTPFCHGYACPLANVIPELNDLAWQGRRQEALALLLATNPFPEFTGRLCPALCEEACVLAVNDAAVAIRQIELVLVEEGFAGGYLQPAPPLERLAARVAVVGSGPAGLAAADTLNKAGYQVVVYERAARVGGILRYGVPEFKLEKWVLDRRVQLMEKEGVRFETGVEVGTDISSHYLRSRFNAICLCGGAGTPRDLKVPGRELAGIHFAMDYLGAQNRKNAGEHLGAAAEIDARGKHVVIIGGGDTGADCLGTAIRQGARSVQQLEILPEPPSSRPAATPWPMWGAIRRDAASHKEGGVRRWGISAIGFKGRNGCVSRVACVEVSPVRRADGALEFVPRSGPGFELEAELVLLALGYTAPGRDGIAAKFQLEGEAPATPGATLRSGGREAEDSGEYQLAGARGVFIAGDMRSGPSLVARSMADGIAAARAIMRWLQKDCIV